MGDSSDKARPDATGARAPRHRLKRAVLVLSASALVAAVLAADRAAGFGVALGLLAAFAGSRAMHRPSAPATPAGIACAPGDAEAEADRRWERGEQAAHLRAILDGLGDLAVTCDLSGRVLFANKAFRAATGADHPEGVRLIDLGVRPAVARTQAGGEAAGGSGGNGPAALLRLGPPEAPRWYEWRQVASRDPHDGALLVHGIGRDVTGHHRAEQELIAERERAEEASAAKSRFLAMVSHEVRTPLNGILGTAGLLAKTTLTREQESYVAALRQSGRALMALIEDLLDFSSIEAGRFALRPEHGPVRALVGDVVELCAPRADDKAIEIAAHVAPDVPETVLCDHARLRQVLFNLLGNAIKFTETGGVAVDVDVEAGEIVYRVRDTGPGLREEDQTRIFLEFEQAESGSTRRHGGAGLGLAISARLVAAMGGTIAVDSRPGEGSVFSVRLPLGAAVAPPPALGRPLAGARVLLLAPPGPTAEALERMIADRGGWAVRAGAEGEATALAASLTEGAPPFGAVVIDNRLAADSPALLGALPAPLVGSARRVLMVTASERGDLARAGALGARSWLIRPLREASVLAVLAGVEEGQGPPAARLAGQPPARPMEPSAGPAPEGPPRPRPRALRVLLAEDNPINAMLVEAALSREGHSVTVVGNGRELVERLATRAAPAYDVVLTDLSMPVMDGVEAIRRIRADDGNGRGARLPIIVLSADGQDETRRMALAEGADAYVAKPVDPDDLARAVRAAAGGPASLRAIS